ncbi:DUF6998 domain-containing protein [Flavobacterium sp. UBA7682]|uniref:DUF6998 domain-containing protein n=1 Tax=Flavobacterium sp. UBA7682 TaxID=1946560 RepID=UPI0025BDE564|nr:hypothetical protein [Flavobacterium sp. UBA7682]
MLTTFQQELLKKFADLSDQLFDYGVIETDSFTGEIGEYYACQLFDLGRTKKVTRAVDAICKEGKRYQVKAKVVSGSFNYSIKKLETDLFDFLIVVYFDRSYSLLKVLKIESDKIPESQINLTKSNLNSFEIEIPPAIPINLNVQKTIKLFAEAYHDLEKHDIIRSRRIVGDIGEFYAATHLNLTLSHLKNEKGIDARDASGRTFEIKTRRVYQSGRRVNETRRINNLEGKHANYIVVVTLDRCFQCSGMWIMSTKNIVNPKQAKLQIVNNTPETYTVVPSTIPWLANRSQFKGFTETTQMEPIKKKPKIVFKDITLKAPKPKAIKKESKEAPISKNTSFSFGWELIVIGLIILFVMVVMITTEF